MWERACLLYDSISTAATFVTEASQETFKIRSGSLTCDSEKVFYLLKCKVYGKSNFVICLTIIKVNVELLERVVRKSLVNYFILTVAAITTAA